MKLTKKQLKDIENAKRQFILIDIKGETLSIGDEIAFPRASRTGASWLNIGYICAIKKCDKTVSISVKASSRYYGNNYSIKFLENYSLSGTRNPKFLKLDRGLIFDLDKPEFARLFAEKVQFLQDNPHLIPDDVDDDAFGFSEFEKEKS